jgi:hypothetical protein
MNAFGVQNGDRREQLQLGRDNLKTIKHMCTVGLDAEGRGCTKFLHGLVPARCHVRKERLRQHESKMACCGDPSPRLLQHSMGEQVQNILHTHLH